MGRSQPAAKTNSSANIGFEQKLWLAADKLRSNMDAAEYKHVVLGLIFLKYISDSFEEHHAKLIAGKDDYADANPEDPDEYRAENIFWVTPAARWTYLQKKAAKGIFITTSEFHDNARDYVAGLVQKIILIGGHRLAELMIEHNIGVAEEHAYRVKKIDSDYFEES